MKQDVDSFLDKYRELEELVKAKYDLADHESPVVFISNLRDFTNLKRGLDVCRRTRDLLSHNSKINNNYVVAPSRELIGILDEAITRIIHPILVSSVMVPVQHVCFAKSDDLVRPILKKMVENVYTHIPILSDGRVAGVFSENTLLSLIAKEEIIGIDNDMTFANPDIEELLPIDKHETEVFKFTPKDMLLSDARGLFEEAIKNDNRIGLLFVTQNGSVNERILGIVSSWDIAGLAN